MLEYRHSLSVGFSLVVATIVGCVVDLEVRVACGDGYVDAAAGEECDPAVPSSYQHACGTGKNPAGCDPETCVILDDLEHCATCGDRVREGDEECDGNDLGGARCPDGSESVRCDSCKLDYGQCPTCGNGTIDPGEECDPLAGPLDPAVDCSTLLHPNGKRYFRGAIRRCLADCRYDLSECSFCGDGWLDDAYTPPGSDRRPAEVCDGQARGDALAELCRSACTGTTAGNVVLSCDFACAVDCAAVQPVLFQDPHCCIPSGEACPPPEGRFPCCWALEHPDRADDACIATPDDPSLAGVCR